MKKRGSPSCTSSWRNKFSSTSAAIPSNTSICKSPFGSQTAIAPPVFVVAIVFVVIMAGYGISSILKAQRISRS